MSLSAVLTAAISGTLTRPETFNDKAGSQNLNYAYSRSFANGTGANQANQVYIAERSLADGADEDLDLSGSLSNPFGVTVAFTGVKGLLVENQSSDASLIVSPGASNGWTGPFGGTSPTITIPPGAAWLITNPTAAGWGVTAGTGDLLNFEHDGTGTSALAYKVAIIGITA